MDSLSTLHSTLDPMDDKRFKETEKIIQKQIERSQNILDDQLAKTAALIERQIERARSFLEQKDFDVKERDKEMLEAPNSTEETITVDHSTNLVDVNQQKSLEQVDGTSMQTQTDNIPSLHADKFGECNSAKVSESVVHGRREVTPDPSYSVNPTTVMRDVHNVGDFQLENQCDEQSYSPGNHADHLSKSEDSLKICSLSTANPTLESIDEQACSFNSDNSTLYESKTNHNIYRISDNLTCPQQQTCKKMIDSSTSTTDLLKYVNQTKSSSYSSGEEHTSAMPVDSETDALSTSYDYSSISFDTVICNNRLRRNNRIKDDAVANISDNVTSSSTKTEKRETGSLSCVNDISKDGDVHRVTYESKLAKEVDLEINRSGKIVSENKEMTKSPMDDEGTVPECYEYNKKQNLQNSSSSGDANTTNNNDESGVEVINENPSDDNNASGTLCEVNSSTNINAKSGIGQVTQTSSISYSKAKENTAKVNQGGCLDIRIQIGNTQQSQTTDESKTKTDHLEERNNTIVKEDRSTAGQVEEITQSPSLDQVDNETIQQTGCSKKIGIAESLSVNEKEKEQTAHKDIFNDSTVTTNAYETTNENNLLKDMGLDKEDRPTGTCNSEVENLDSSRSDRKRIDSSIKSEKGITTESTEKPNTFVEKQVNTSRAVHDTSTQSEPIWDYGCDMPKDTSSYPICKKRTLKQLVKEDVAVFPLPDNRKQIARNIVSSGDTQNSSSHLDDTESEPIWNFDNTKMKRTSSYPLLSKTTPKRIIKDNTFPFWKLKRKKANDKDLKPMMIEAVKHVEKGLGAAFSYPLNKFNMRSKKNTADDKLKTFPFVSGVDDEDDTISNSSFTEESIHELLDDEEISEKKVDDSNSTHKTREKVKSHKPLSDDNISYAVSSCSERQKEEVHKNQQILNTNNDSVDPKVECEAENIKTQEKADCEKINKHVETESRTSNSINVECVSKRNDDHKPDSSIELCSQPSVSNISKSYGKMRYTVDVSQNDYGRQTRSLTELAAAPKGDQFLAPTKSRRRCWSLSKQGSIPETSYLSSNVSSGDSHEKLISICCPTGTEHRENGEECECTRVPSEKQNIPMVDVSLQQENSSEQKLGELASPTNVDDRIDNEEFSVSKITPGTELDGNTSEQLPSASGNVNHDTESIVDSNAEDLDSSYFERERYKATPSLDSTDLSFAFEESETCSSVDRSTPQDGTTGRPELHKLPDQPGVHNENRCSRTEDRRDGSRVNSFCESDISTGNDNISSSIIQFSSINASIEGSTEDIVIDDSCRSSGSGYSTSAKPASKRKPIASTLSSTQSIISSKSVEDFSSTTGFTHDPLMDKTSLGDATDVEDSFLIDEDLESTTVSNRTDVLGTSSETVTQVENPAYDRQ